MYRSENYSCILSARAIRVLIIILILVLLSCQRQHSFVASMNAAHSPHHHVQKLNVNSSRISSNVNAGSQTQHLLKTPHERTRAIWNELPFTVTLEPDERLVYSWDWNESPSPSSEDETKVATIQVKAKISKQAWLAIGFSNNGSFYNADFCVLFADQARFKVDGKQKKLLLYDGWTDGDGVMHVDAQQDCRLLDAYFDAHAQVVLRYEREFDTCDDPYDYVIEDGTTHVVYALGVGPINSIEGLQLNDDKHVYGGFERVTFTKPHLQPVAYPSDTKIIDITAAQVHVPTENDTTYWCIVQKMPDLKTKNHIVRYEAVISSGSEDLVHHIEVFHCELPAKTKVPTYQGLCHAENRPKELDHCTRVIGAWAMGAPPLEYPPNAGYPIGGDQYSSYVLIEMHYNNPQHKAGIVDSSGIRFYVTASPRPFDIGVMELGLEYTPKMSIPPNTKSTLLHGHCIAECTQAGLPADGIIIFASQLHTHLTGVRVQTRHVRNGIELPLLNGDKHFNSMFQEIRRLRRPVRVLPGDELLTTCEYNTLDRPNVTLGGFGIGDEMCVNYVHYYPRTNLEVCKSSVDSNALADFFDFLRIQNCDEDVDAEKNSVEQNYINIRYTPLVAGLQSQFYDQAPLAMQCNKSDGTRFAGSWNRQHKICVDRPLPVPERVACRRRTSMSQRSTWKKQNSVSAGLDTVSANEDEGAVEKASDFLRQRLSMPKLLLLPDKDGPAQQTLFRQLGLDNDQKKFLYLKPDIAGGTDAGRDERLANNFRGQQTQQSIIDRLFSNAANAKSNRVKRISRQLTDDDFFVGSKPRAEIASFPQVSDKQLASANFDQDSYEQNDLSNLLLQYMYAQNYASESKGTDAPDDLGEPEKQVDEDKSIPSSDDEDSVDERHEGKHVPMLHMHG